MQSINLQENMYKSKKKIYPVLLGLVSCTHRYTPDFLYRPCNGVEPEDPQIVSHVGIKMGQFLVSLMYICACTSPKLGVKSINNWTYRQLSQILSIYVYLERSLGISLHKCEHKSSMEKKQSGKNSVSKSACPQNVLCSMYCIHVIYFLLSYFTHIQMFTPL